MEPPPPVSLVRTHGLMCTSKSYVVEPEYKTPRVFPFTQWKSFLQDRSTCDQVNHKDGVCDEASPPTVCGDITTSGQRGKGHNQHDWEQVKEKDRCQTARKGPHSGIDPQSHPACRALIDMGYSMREVKKAADRIKKQGLALTVETLIDVITETSDRHDDASTESDDEEADGLCTCQSPVCMPQSQPSTATGFSEDLPVDLHSPEGAIAFSSPTSNEALSNGDDCLETDNYQKQMVEELRAKNEKLKQSTTCKICLDADVNTVFLPCGHLVCCRECADNVADCPVCRQGILGTVRTFLA